MKPLMLCLLMAFLSSTAAWLAKAEKCLLHLPIMCPQSIPSPLPPMVSKNMKCPWDQWVWCQQTQRLAVMSNRFFDSWLMVAYNNNPPHILGRLPSSCTIICHKIYLIRCHLRYGCCPSFLFLPQDSACLVCWFLDTVCDANVISSCCSHNVQVPVISSPVHLLSNLQLCHTNLQHLHLLN